MTGRGLITSTLRLIRAIASGDTPTAEEASDGLAALNTLIDSLSNEKLLIYELKKESSITLVAGTADYTLGTGGDITTRPMSIDAATIQDASSSNETPVRILSKDEWIRIPDKTFQSEIPTQLFDKGGFPLRTVTLYPVPSTANKLNLYTSRPLTQVASLDTEISLPPGYERMLKYNLAIDIGPEYGKQVDMAIAQIAVDSKNLVKRSNFKPQYLRVDSALSSGGRYNIMTGDYE